MITSDRATPSLALCPEPSPSMRGPALVTASGMSPFNETSPQMKKGALAIGVEAEVKSIWVLADGLAGLRWWGQRCAGMGV